MIIFNVSMDDDGEKFVLDGGAVADPLGGHTKREQELVKLLSDTINAFALKQKQDGNFVKGHFVTNDLPTRD